MLSLYSVKETQMSMESRGNDERINPSYQEKKTSVSVIPYTTSHIDRPGSNSELQGEKLLTKHLFQPRHFVFSHIQHAF